MPKHVSKSGPFPHYGTRYAMDMPLIETLAEARHFIEGPAAYAGRTAPWQGAIRSWQRPDGPRLEVDMNGAAGNGATRPAAEETTASAS